MECKRITDYSANLGATNNHENHEYKEIEEPNCSCNMLVSLYSHDPSVLHGVQQPRLEPWHERNACEPLSR